MRALTGILFSLGLVLMQQGCSVTSTVVATLDGYDELMVGQVNGNLWSGGGEFNVKGKNSGLNCQGVALPPYAVANNLSLSCAGMVGRGNAECSDGRTVEFKWRADSCMRTHGEGEDSIGNTFYFVTGLDETEAEAYIQQELIRSADKPPLSTYKLRIAVTESGLSTGTGFYVTDDGLIVTSYHVIENADSIHVMNVENGARLPARLLFTDPENDIALIKTEAKSQAIPIASHFSSVLGDEVFTLGYPLASDKTQDQKLAFGRITSLSGPDFNGRMVQTDIPIQPGNAGGPLLNEKGEVIGMITTSLEEILRLRASGSLLPNINLAINIDQIKPALESEQTGRFRAPEDNSGKMNLTRIVELRESSVLLVIAE